MAKKSSLQVIASNKKAFHDYHVLNKLEAGIVLEGCEVKSIRAGHVVLKDSFARLKNDELWLMNCYISPYEQASHSQPEPERDRKLLVHRSQLKKLAVSVDQKGHYLIPLRIYISKQIVKVELGVCSTKKQYDKRHVLKEKDINRDISRTFKTQPR